MFSVVKMRMHLLAVTLLALFLGLAVSCAPQVQDRQSPKKSASVAGPLAPVGPSYGSSSGGGGFVDENSTRLLHQAATGLAKFIRLASPQILDGLPNGWTPERLAKVIENVRYEAMVEKSREGRQLMFDYGTDASGPFIVALKPFFVAYSSFPIKFSDSITLGNVLRDIRLKLAHETAHHLGMNEKDAEIFGRKILNDLERDVIECRSESAEDWLNFDRTSVPGSPAVRVRFVFHRVSGLGYLQAYRISEGTPEHINSKITTIATDRTEFMDQKIEELREGLLNDKDLLADFHTEDTKQTELKRDIYFGGEAIFRYFWTPSSIGANGEMSFQARNPIGKVESLTLEKTKTKNEQLSAKFVFDSHGQLKSLVLQCKHSSQKSENARQPLPDDRRDRFKSVSENPELAPHLARLPQIDRQLEPILSEKLASIQTFKPLEFRNLGYRGSKRTFELGLAKSVVLKDGRTCAIGIECNMN